MSHGKFFGRRQMPCSHKKIDWQDYTEEVPEDFLADICPAEFSSEEVRQGATCEGGCE